MSSEVPGHAFTSLLSSTLMGTTETRAVANHSTVGMVIDKPFEEFTEVKAATLIDRVLVPVTVCVGLLGNFLCFVTLVFTSLRTTSTCIYMAVIAVLDSVILVVRACILISEDVGHPEFYMNIDWTCGFHYFLFYFAIHMNVLVLLAMTVDRYIVVKFPLKAQSLCTPKSAIKVITGIAIFSFALNFQVFFHRRLVSTKKIGSLKDIFNCWYPGGNIEDFMEKIYTIIDASIYSFIPFVFLLLLNLLIIRELKNSRKFSKQFTEIQERETTHNTNNTNNSTESVTTSSNANTFQSNTIRTKEVKGASVTARRNLANGGNTGTASKKVKENTNIIVMLLLVSFAFLLLTSPVVIVLLLQRYVWLPGSNAERAQVRLIRAFVDNIMFSNHAINFLLYCLSGRRFRQELKQLLARLCGCL